MWLTSKRTNVMARCNSAIESAMLQRTMMYTTGKNQKKTGTENSKKKVAMLYLLLRMLDFAAGTEILSQFFAPPVHLYYNST